MTLCGNTSLLGAELFVLLQIKVKTPKKDADDEDEEEEGSNAVICEECGRSDRRHRLLVCTRCDSGYGMTIHAGFCVVSAYFVTILPSNNLNWVLREGFHRRTVVLLYVPGITCTA